jgi:hypothetical protein
MKWQGSLLSLIVLGTTALAQEPPQATSGMPVAIPVPGLITASPVDGSCPGLVPRFEDANKQAGTVSGNRNFPNFIGYMSNPLFAIDPRSLTEIWPIFLSTWLSPSSPLPSGNVTLPGAGVNIAITERLSMGVNQGGYVLGKFSDSSRDGWLNLGGWVQYTIFEDVPNQCLVTVGIRWEAPTGEAEVFQGHGPPYLAPYATVGKEFGNFHVLATAGYEFPGGPGDVTTRTYYGILHLDHRTFDWLYPLVEFNWENTQRKGNITIPTKRGEFNFSYEDEGNLVVLAAGVNAVLIPERLEIGAVYTTPIASKSGFDFDGMVVRMTIRF